jgi:hypothetical protein
MLRPMCAAVCAAQPARHRGADTNGTLAGVVKLHNVASPMVEASKIRYMRSRYTRGQHYDRKERELGGALASLAALCGLSHVSLAEWFAPLRAVVPASGEVVNIPRALFAERAGGVSLEALTLSLKEEVLLRTMLAVPHAAVRDAAIYDLLFLQGDRHGENIFLGRFGAYFKLIDRRAQAAAAADCIVLC